MDTLPDNIKTDRLFIGFILAGDITHKGENTEINKRVRSPEKPAEIPDAHKFTDEITNDSANDKQSANAACNKSGILTNLM